MKICLNMIVKNEISNIKRCLDAVSAWIDCWVICDTGSSDGNAGVHHGVFCREEPAGELHSTEFRNFGQARNEALDRARRSDLSFDYLLLVDADMELVVESPDVFRTLTASVYMLQQKAGITYWNARLLKRDAQACYRGVTHEYLQVSSGESQMLSGALFVDHASGANRPGKFERDAKLLRDALATEDDPGLVARYTFYLANSLRDDGRSEEALAVYLDRARLGHWEQEVYLSLLFAARLKEALAHPAEDVLAAYAAAAGTCPTRAEAFHGGARFCRNNGLHGRGVDLARQALDLPLPADALFREDWIYTPRPARRVRGECLLAGHHRESLEACLTLLSGEALPDGDRARVAANARFALDRLAEAAPPRAVPAAPAIAWPTTGGTWRAVARPRSDAPWAPDRPLAGTELMVEGLRARMGGALEAVQLCVNGYDPARLDGRPLVVWVHHDVDQRAVQWMRGRGPRGAGRPLRLRVGVAAGALRRDLRAGAGPLPRAAQRHRGPGRRPGPGRPAPAQDRLYQHPVPRPRGAARGLGPAAAGGAELHIWSSHRLYGPAFDDAPHAALFARARSLPNVHHHGIVPNPELREALRDIDVLAYPSTFAETSCLAVIEALAAGCG